MEEARAYSNLGSSHHYKRNFAQAITFHEHVLRIAQQLGDRAIEARYVQFALKKRLQALSKITFQIKF